MKLLVLHQPWKILRRLVFLELEVFAFAIVCQSVVVTNSIVTRVIFPILKLPIQEVEVAFHGSTQAGN